MNDIATNQQKATEYIALKAYEAALKAELAARKLDLEQSIPPGDSVTGRDANGKPMGAAKHTEPSVKARVQNKEVLVLNNMDQVTPAISPEDAAEIIPILLEHAPHLVHEELPDYAVDVLLKRAEAGEEIPGVVVERKAGYISVPSSKPYKELKAYVAGQISGVLELAGVQTRALEAGDDDE
ncbi:hypothetical protein [Corynebacterium variabile]|uniref:hypothetical protein n=1 Tax=Corynebacterium variabile TaxID=1727 RepID=UPI003A9556A3